MFEAGYIYHIYNRANGGESLFKEEKNYDYFQDRYYEYINPVVETYGLVANTVRQQFSNFLMLMQRHLTRSTTEMEAFFNQISKRRR